jgi:hypothetical protein
MTTVDVAFRYGLTPGEAELRALNAAREVYGIRKISFDKKESVIRVEFDATRLNEDTVAALLRRAGIDLKEKLQLA